MDKMRDAILNDDITTIERMITQDGIDVNAVIYVSIIITINILTLHVIILATMYL